MEFSMTTPTTFDVVVVGGGPAGATAADDLARSGLKVMLLDRAGRIKPCGGAIPPRAIRDFQIPESQLVAHATCARMVSPTDRRVDIPIEGGFVGMVDRDKFDEWLRQRAAEHGALRATGRFDTIEQDADGCSVVVFEQTAPEQSSPGRAMERVRARCIIGADGANSAVARVAFPGVKRPPFVFAYHEVVRTPTEPPAGYDAQRCDVIYNGKVSPDFYGWLFPHGQAMSIGTGSANKGFSLRDSVGELRKHYGLESAETIRSEGAPIPLKPLARWDNGKDVVLCGDAAGVVAPASGEGIYYAMACGRMAAAGVQAFLRTSDVRHLAGIRKLFLKEHGRVFWVLGIMQKFWYANDKRRERFVSICQDKDVQQLTFDAYMNKRLVRAKPMAHVRIFFKDLFHLLGLARV
jgi:geranylgeranyl reductase